MHHSASPSLPALLVLSILVAVAPQPVRAETVDIDCFAEADDVDRDGYARNGAPTVRIGVDETKKLYCPAGYVRKKGDCDDNESTVHPNAPEIGFNDQDDNCKQGADEPELVYFPNGNQNTQTSFSIRVRIASHELLDYGSSLAYEVEFADLAATGLSARTPKRFVGVLPSDHAFDAPVTGLAPARVYRARLHFYETISTESRLRGRLLRTTRFEALEIESDWYYSATDGDGLLEDARLDLLLEGFYQLSESDRGRIGYMGTVRRDGTRFGAAAAERWCSEFYSWLGSSQFYQISLAHNVTGVIWWFLNHGQFHSGSAPARTIAKRADYVAVDTTGDGDANHSTMFLAYDVTLDKVWVLEGNDGNAVRVNPRAVGPALRGVGHLTNSGLIWFNLF
jgi:hypothetical protein